MSDEAKKIVRNYWLRTIAYITLTAGLVLFFLFNPADVYTYDWPWFEYHIYVGISLIALIALEILISAIHILQSEKIVRIMNEQCDPYLFEECWKKMKFNHFVKNIYYYNYAVIYLHQGKKEDAWKQMMSIKPNSLKGELRDNYYQLKCDLLYEYRMIDQMKQVEDEFRMGIRNKKDELGFQKLCAQNNMYRAYLNKDYEAAYRFHAEFFECIGPVKFMIQKIHFVYWTGILDKETGNDISARACFRFVIENGNKLKCVNHAKQMIEEMEKPIEKPVEDLQEEGEE